MGRTMLAKLSGSLAGDVLVYRKNTTLGIDLGQSDDILVGEIPATGPNKGKLINNTPIILLPHLKKEIEHFPFLSVVVFRSLDWLYKLTFGIGLEFKASITVISCA